MTETDDRAVSVVSLSTAILSLCDRLILVSNEVIVYTNVSASDVLTDSKIRLIETCNLLDLEASRGSRALEESCLSRMHTPTYIY